nr:GreA/GreB family elongation factor [Bradyrhizobium pachyrhizi]
MEGRPPIVLTEKDREILSRLLRDATDAGAACLLREEIDRAEIVPDGVAMESLVRLGSEVKFVEQENPMARRARLVVPEQAADRHCISVLTSVGSALIGLGPGQSFRWTERGLERSLAVLAVGANRALTHFPLNATHRFRRP